MNESIREKLIKMFDTSVYRNYEDAVDKIIELFSPTLDDNVFINGVLYERVAIKEPDEIRSNCFYGGLQGGKYICLMADCPFDGPCPLGLKKPVSKIPGWEQRLDNLTFEPPAHHINWSPEYKEAYFKKVAYKIKDFIRKEFKEIETEVDSAYIGYNTWVTKIIKDAFKKRGIK